MTTGDAENPAPRKPKRIANRKARLARKALLPDRRTLRDLIISGVIGLVGWELIARVLAPLLIGGPLEPAALIITLFENRLGMPLARLPAEMIHVLIGGLLYPLLFWFLSRFMHFGARLDGLVWGVGTWIVAMGGLTTIAGVEFWLGFYPITWISLAGHLLYWQAIVLVYAKLRARRNR